MPTVEARVTGVQADLTLDEMTVRVTAIQADLTHTEKTARVTAMRGRTTFTTDGDDLTDPGVRVTAIQAAITRPIHHHIEYEASGLHATLTYERPAPATLTYEAPLDPTAFSTQESPPRGGKNPYEEV